MNPRYVDEAVIAALIICAALVTPVIIAVTWVGRRYRVVRR